MPIQSLSEIPDLQVEYRADRGVQVDHAGNVTQLDDQSGRGSHGVVNPGSLAPIYVGGDRPAIVFGSASSMGGTGNSYPQINIPNVTQTERNCTVLMVLRRHAAIRRTTGGGSFRDMRILRGQPDLHIRRGSDGTLGSYDGGDVDFPQRLPSHFDVLAFRSQPGNQTRLLADRQTATVAATGSATATSMQIGWDDYDNAAGGGWGSLTPTMELAHFALINRSISDTEWDDAVGYLRSLWGCPASSRATRVVLVGDSMMEGVRSNTLEGSIARRLLDRYEHDIDLYNIAEGGSQLDDLTGNEISARQGVIAGYYDPAASHNVAVLWAGTNDIAIGNASAATAYARMQAQATAIRSAGYQLVVLGTLARGGGATAAQQTAIADFNSLMRADHSWCDRWIDLYQHPQLGGATAYEDRRWFDDDDVHLSDWGNALVEAEIAAALPSLGVPTPGVAAPAADVVATAVRAELATELAQIQSIPTEAAPSVVEIVEGSRNAELGTTLHATIEPNDSDPTAADVTVWWRRNGGDVAMSATEVTIDLLSVDPPPGETVITATVDLTTASNTATATITGADAATVLGRSNLVAVIAAIGGVETTGSVQVVREADRAATPADLAPLATWEQVAAAGTVTAEDVSRRLTWTFPRSGSSTTASRFVEVNAGFMGDVQFDITGLLHDGNVINSVSPTVTVSGTGGPTASTPRIHTSRRKLLIGLTGVTTAGTYTVSATYTTSDSQTVTVKGTLRVK